MVDLIERIDVMLDQETRFYSTRDYLAPEFQKKLTSFCEPDAFDSPKSSHGSEASSASSGINEVWREKICEWSYQVIDHFDFSREVVSISIHYLDRYLATRPVNKKTFQLAAMTSVFMAVKLYEHGRLSIPSMIELSRGYFQVEQMAAMEISILRALQWHVHPPTAYCFSKHMLLLLPASSVNLETRHTLLELARFLTELSVIDYYFVIHKPSTVALAALMNAMDEIPGASLGMKDSFIQELCKVTGQDLSGDELAACRKRLRQLYEQGGYAHPNITEMRAESVSPICISYGCSPANTAEATPLIKPPF